MIADHYNIEIALSTMLSSKIVEEIVRKQVEDQTGRKIIKIAINYDSNKFDGFHITFAPETSVKTYKTSKEFIEQRWK